MYNSHLFRLSALLVTIIIAFVSCSEDDCPSCPENTDGNLFTVRVLDTSGNPLRDIRVGSINHHYQTAATRKSSGSALATALINFSIAEHGYVKLDIFNYYAQWVETVIDSVHMNAGSYAAEWLGTDHNDNVVVSGYYFAQLWTESAADTTVLVLELGSEPSQTIIGSTDNDGYFVTNDTLYFPGLLGSPPEVIVIDEFGNSTDSSFHYSDTVTITLSDPDTPTEFILIDRVLTTGVNYLELTWDPALAD